MNNNNQTNGRNNSFKKKAQGLQDKVSRGIATHLGRKTNSIISNAARDKGKNHGAGGSSLRPVDRDVSKRMQLSKSISRDMNHAARQARRRNDPYKSAMIKSQAAGMGLKLGGVGGSMNLNDARMQEATKNSQLVNQFGQSMASDPSAPAGQGRYDGSGGKDEKKKINVTNPDVISQVGSTAQYADGTYETQEGYDKKEQENMDFYNRHKDGVKGALDTSRDKIKSAWDKISGFASDKFSGISGFASGGEVGYASGGEVAGNGNIPTQPNGDDTLATLKSGEVVLTKEQQAALGGDKALAKAGVPGFASGGAVGMPEHMKDNEQRVLDIQSNSPYGGLLSGNWSPPSFSAGGGEVNPYFNMNQANSPSLFAGAGTGPLTGTDPYTPSRLSDNATPFRPVAPVGHRPIQYPPQSPFGGDAIDWKVEDPPYPQAEYQSGESPPPSVSGDLPTSGQPSLRSRPPLPPLSAPQSPIPTPSSEISSPKTSKSPIQDLADIKAPSGAASDAAYQQSLDDEVLYGKSEAAGFGSDINSYNVAKDRADATVAEIKKNRKAGKTALGFDRGKNPDGSDRKQWKQLTADEILKAQKSNREHAARNKKLSDLKKDPTYGMDARTKAYFEAPAKRKKAKQAERAARKKESEAFKAELQRSLDIEDLKKTDPEKAMDYIEKQQSNEKVKAGLKESNRVKARNKRLGL